MDLSDNGARVEARKKETYGLWSQLAPVHSLCAGASALDINFESDCFL